MRKSRIGMVVAVSLLSVVSVGPVFAAGGRAAAANAAAKATKAAHPAPHKLSMEDARKLALARVPGKIHAEELELEHGGWIYSFEIVPDRGNSGEIKEVNIDADSGAIRPIETEKKTIKGARHENDGDGEENDDVEGAGPAEDGESAD